MTTRLSRLLWPGLIFVFLGGNVCIVTITVIAANSDGGNASEPDYYQKAVNWDSTMGERARSDALGWDLSVVPNAHDGVFLLTDGNGGPIENAAFVVEHFLLNDPSRRTTSSCSPLGGGRYQLAGPLSPGVREFRVRAEVGERVFVRTIRADNRPEARR